MFVCSQCQHEFNNLRSKSAHENKCIEAHTKYGHIDLEELKFLYYNENYSLYDLSKYYGVGKGLRNYMKRLNLPLRNISESKTEKVKTKQISTNIEKTGHPHNFSKNHPSRLKWESEMVRDEGISNVFLRASVKEKIKETLIKNFGVDHPMKCEEIVDRVMHSRSLNPNKKFIRFSSIHKKVCNLLDEMGINYEIEFYLKGENKRCFYDIKIGNLLIEVNGNYWHANPVLYRAKDLLSFHGNIFTAEDIWKIDKEKEELAVKNDYNVLYLWETDINNDFEKVKQIINEKCKN
jgi:hypothetical protein